MHLFEDFAVNLKNESIRHSMLNSPNAQRTVNGKRIFLRSFPGTTVHHDSNCRFFSLPVEMTARNYLSARAFSRNDETGEITMRGDMPLVSRGRQLADSDGPMFYSNKPGRKKQATMTQLGVLQELLESSGINTYTPSRGIECWEHVVRRIHRLSLSTTYNKKPLSTRLFFLGSPDKLLTKDWFRSSGSFKQSTKNNFMVLCPVAGITKSTYGYQIVIPGEKRRIYCTAAQADNFNRKFKLAVNAQSSSSDSCIALILCSWSKSQAHLNAESIVALPLDKHYLPYDSSYERQLNEYLVWYDRCFIKPIRQSDYLHTWSFSGKANPTMHRRS